MVNYSMQNPMNAFMGTVQGMQNIEANQMAMDQQRQNQAAQQQQQQANQATQTRIGELVPLIQSGDYDASIELASISPEISAAIGKAQLGASEVKDRATADWIAGYQSAPDKDAYLSQDNQLIDIDDQFRTIPLEQRDVLTKIVGAQVMPKDMFNAAFGGQPEAMTAYQQATIDTKKVDQDLRKLEIEQKSLDARYKRETDELKRSELEQKIEANKANKEAKVAEKEQSKVQAVDFSNEVYDLATSIANDPQLNDITGPVNTMLPTVSGKSQDLINKAERLESMLTKENLGLMSGVLTDKDIQMLRSISSGINVTDGGIKGSYEGTKKRLMQIAEKIQSATGDSAKPTGNSFTSSSGVQFTVE